MKIVILEDNNDRRAVMRACMSDRFHQYELVFFDAARPMIDFLRKHLDEILVVALDHDLDLIPGESAALMDPGDGRDVADFLSSQRAVCEVVIHTTNAPAAAGMKMVLQDADWRTHRVAPYGDLQWIDEQWFPAMRNAIVNSVDASPVMMKHEFGPTQS